MTIFTTIERFKVAEIELIYKSKQADENKIIVEDANKAYQAFKNSWDMNKIELVEQFKVLLLNPDMSCLGIADIASGGITNCMVDPKLVFAAALTGRATSLILAHNHPSGNLNASPQDIAVTKKLVSGGLILDIPVVDHLIVTRNAFASMAEKGLMP